MRRPVLVLALAAGLLTACSGSADDTGAPAGTPGPVGTTTSAAPATGTPGPSAPVLSRTQQQQGLARIFGGLDPAARRQFSAQSDQLGAQALAEQLTERGASMLDADLLEEFLVETCGAG